MRLPWRETQACEASVLFCNNNLLLGPFKRHTWPSSHAMKWSHGAQSPEQLAKAKAKPALQGVRILE
eukprot:scaffold66311_cov20-Tisochrysis_lutea.AAC.2